MKLLLATTVLQSSPQIIRENSVYYFSFCSSETGTPTKQPWSILLHVLLSALAAFYLRSDVISIFEVEYTASMWNADILVIKLSSYELTTSLTAVFQ